MSDKKLDTRGYVNQLLDSEAVLGVKEHAGKAIELIRELPSFALLFYIAKINLELYLNDSGDSGQRTQNMLMKGFLRYPSHLVHKLIHAYSQAINNQQWPTIFYRYSNLVFFELILDNYNTKPPRELTPSEMEKFIHSYLIINSIVNERININVDEFDKAIESNNAERVIIAQFIYQKDYTSNSDYTNQITRCYHLFKYLENDDRFKELMSEYYSGLGVDSMYDIIYKVVIIFSQILKGEPGQRNPIFRPIDDIGSPHNRFLLQLSFNPAEFKYAKDMSFTWMRNQMFIQTPNKKFLICDINFYIDYLYKGQVFRLNDFMKSKGIRNFLTIKAEAFMERIYLNLVMNRCFPKLTCIPATDLAKRDKNPLTDYIIKGSNKIMIIEFKDTFFSAVAKNSGDANTVLNELYLKHYENQQEGAKSIRQLSMAINYLSGAPPEFAHLLNNCTEVFPIVIFTDNTFGYDGINKIFREEFRTLVGSRPGEIFTIHDVIFVNLSFFEVFENSMRTGLIDPFEVMTAYNKHIQEAIFSMAPFDVFAAMFIRNRTANTTGHSALYLEAREAVNAHFR